VDRPLRQRARSGSQKESAELWKQRAEQRLKIWSSVCIPTKHKLLDLAASILDARLATAQGDRERAITYWENAVRIQDTLYYGEPPEWFYPVRESLGSALLLNGTG